MEYQNILNEIKLNRKLVEKKIQEEVKIDSKGNLGLWSKLWIEAAEKGGIDWEKYKVLMIVESLLRFLIEIDKENKDEVFLRSYINYAKNYIEKLKLC